MADKDNFVITSNGPNDEIQIQRFSADERIYTRSVLQANLNNGRKAKLIEITDGKNEEEELAREIIELHAKENNEPLWKNQRLGHRYRRKEG